MNRRDFLINSAITLAGTLLLSACGRQDLITSAGKIAKRKFKDLEIPLLGFGCMRLPQKDGEIDYNETEKMVEYAMQHEANYFDTAYMYMEQKSEIVMGKILKQLNRKDIFIADKAPLVFMNTKDDVKRIFEEQLIKKVNTDYFDFYMVHNINKDTIQKYKDFGVYEQIMDFKRQGLVKNVGFSFHGSPEMLKEVALGHDWDFCQLQINYYDWDSPIKSKEQYEISQKSKLPVIIMEPLRGGALCKLCNEAGNILKQKMPDDTQASYALRWVASLNNILTVLSGMSNLHQMKENIATFENFTPLTSSEFKLANELREEIKKRSAIACTTCRYCMEVCPNGIAIPEIFSLYNSYKNDGNKWLFKTYYDAIPDKSKADKCIKCGLCNKNCPQALKIPDLLEKIDSELKSLRS